MICTRALGLCPPSFHSSVFAPWYPFSSALRLVTPFFRRNTRKRLLKNQLDKSRFRSRLCLFSFLCLSILSGCLGCLSSNEERSLRCTTTSAPYRVSNRFKCSSKSPLAFVSIIRAKDSQQAISDRSHAFCGLGLTLD